MSQADKTPQNAPESASESALESTSGAQSGTIEGAPHQNLDSTKSESAPAPQTNHLRILFLSVLYSGKSPKAPGTAGSVLSVFLGLPILYYSAQTLFLLALLLGALAIRAIDRHEQEAGIHDESWIVIDELVGVWVAMAMAGLSVVGVVLALVLFRVFDIWKPSIIGKIDRDVKGGLGVVGDDFIAGLIAGIASLALIALCQYANILLNLWLF